MEAAWAWPPKGHTEGDSCSHPAPDSDPRASNPPPTRISWLTSVSAAASAGWARSRRLRGCVRARVTARGSTTHGIGPKDAADDVRSRVWGLLTAKRGHLLPLGWASPAQRRARLWGPPVPGPDPSLPAEPPGVLCGVRSGRAPSRRWGRPGTARAPVIRNLNHQVCAPTPPGSRGPSLPGGSRPPVPRGCCAAGRQTVGPAPAPGLRLHPAPGAPAARRPPLCGTASTHFLVGPWSRGRLPSTKMGLCLAVLTQEQVPGGLGVLCPKVGLCLC